MLVKLTISAVLAGALTAGAAAAAGITHEVSIYDNDFMPPLIYAEPGDTVLILNEDDVVRQATANDDAWTTGPLQPGQSYTVTLDNTTQLHFASVDPSQDEDGNTYTPTAEITFQVAPLE